MVWLSVDFGLKGRNSIAQVIGATDAHGAYPLGPSQSPGDVAATIYEALGVDAQAPLHDGQGRPLPVVPDGAAISGILR